MIEIYETEPWFNSDWITGPAWMYPTVMKKDGREFFMFNRRDPDETYRLNEQEAFKKMLIANDGKYFKFNGFYDDPFEMLREVAERKHTFTEKIEKVLDYSGNTLNFHGNRREVSAAFFYRIYDGEMQAKIEEAVKHIFAKEYGEVLT